MEDTAYMTKMATSFLDELTEIEKKGFNPLGFLRGGVRNIGKAMAAKGGTGLAARLGGKGAARAGGLGAHIKQIYGAGAKKAMGQGGSGMLGGLGAVGRSRYGQMAGALAVPVAAGYGLSKLTS
jgi:hypothetical protein